jgi:hypothetical protein
MTKERLARLRTLATSSVVGADLKWLLERYDQLRVAATPIAEALRQVGDETDWRDGNETDRVYAWGEIEPLWKALAGSLAETPAPCSKPETAAHAVRGSDGQRYVCLGFEEAVSKAQRLADEFPALRWSIVELIERPPADNQPYCESCKR